MLANYTSTCNDQEPICYLRGKAQHFLRYYNGNVTLLPKRVAPAVLTDKQVAELAKLSRSRRTSVRLAQRAHIVLLAARRLQNKDIAQQMGIGRVQVARWRARYLQVGIERIERDLPRGAPPVKVDAARLVELTTSEQAKGGHALEYSHDGGRAGGGAQHRVAALAKSRPEAARGARLQGLA